MSRVFENAGIGTPHEFFGRGIEHFRLPGPPDSHEPPIGLDQRIVTAKGVEYPFKTGPATSAIRLRFSDNTPIAEIYPEQADPWTHSEALAAKLKCEGKYCYSREGFACFMLIGHAPDVHRKLLDFNQRRLLR